MIKDKLTTEQSRHLIEMGVDKSLASEEVIENVYQQEYNEPRPRIFTLSDIISIIPKEIVIKDKKDCLTMGMDDEWCIAGYMALDIRFARGELIDSLYALLVWSIEHNHFNLNIKQ